MDEESRYELIPCYDMGGGFSFEGEGQVNDVDHDVNPFARKTIDIKRRELREGASLLEVVHFSGMLSKEVASQQDYSSMVKLFLTKGNHIDAKAVHELLCSMVEVIIESLVKKKKQKGAILELKRRHLKKVEICINTPYPTKKIWRISASSSQERVLINSRSGETMNDPNITIEEYIRLEEEKAQSRDFVTEFPAKVFSNTFTSDTTPPCEPTISPPNEVELDFRISCDESDDEDYMVIFDESSFSYKIISVNDLKTVSENDNKVPLSPNPTIDYDLDYFHDFKNEFPAIVYNDGLTSKSDLGIKNLVSAESTDEFDFNETSKYEDEIISHFNDLFNDIHSDDSKSEIDNEDNNIGIVQSSGGNENTLGENGLSETSHDENIETFETGSFVTNLNIIIYYCVIGMLFFLIMNPYVPFGIPFDPKRYYKDGSHTKVTEAKVRSSFNSENWPLYGVYRKSYTPYLLKSVIHRIRQFPIRCILRSYEQRLETIWSRLVNRVHVLDFAGLTPEMRQDLAVRLRMVYTGEQGQFILALGLHTEQEMAEVGFGAYWAGSDRLIPDNGDLRDYWLQISSDKDFLGPAPFYVLIRDPVRRLCHRMIAYSTSGRGQAPEKVIGVDLFYLRSMDHGTINVPHLLAQYLFRHAKGRKSGARLSGGHFIRCLALHFRLVSDEGLRGLLVVTRELPLIDLHELGRLNICTRIERLEEEVHNLRRDVVGLRGDVASFTTEQSRVSTWLISCMTQLMDASGQTYQPFDNTLVDSRLAENCLTKKIAMAEPDLNGTNTHPCLSNPHLVEQKSDKSVKIELGTELIMKLRNNAYDGTEIDDAEKGYDNDKLDYDEESSDDECNNGDNRLFFDHHQNDNNKGDKNNQKERSDHSNRPENFVQNDAPQSSNNKPNEGMCRMDKIEVIKYSVGDNEEFLGVRALEHNSWAQNVNGVSSIYLAIFRKKDEGNYEVTCKEEAKRRNSRAQMNTFEESIKLHQYAVSRKKIRRIRARSSQERVLINSRSGVSTTSQYAVCIAVSSVKDSHLI
ncbi:hypothetical protein Tco_0978500 [Tanacetum coccineum]|uniref:Uncharacterized protein n=1 Tax=Tanacetum coccineum TaxID=301880 RepID=A0ABQ5ENK4_9ASTR